jgi:hypothetical protein
MECTLGKTQIMNGVKEVCLAGTVLPEKANYVSAERYIDALVVSKPVQNQPLKMHFEFIKAFGDCACLQYFRSSQSLKINHYGHHHPS